MPVVSVLIQQGKYDPNERETIVPIRRRDEYGSRTQQGNIAEPRSTLSEDIFHLQSGPGQSRYKDFACVKCAMLASIMKINHTGPECCVLIFEQKHVDVDFRDVHERLIEHPVTW